MSARRLKLALVHNNSFGGAWRASIEKARRLAARGHSVDLWTLEPAARGPLPQRTAPGARYVPLLDLGGLSIAASPLGPLERRRLRGAYEALARAVDGERYDVVVTEGCRYVQQPLLHTLLRTPAVIFVNEVFRFVHERPPGLGLAKRAALAVLSPWHASLARGERRELVAARALATLSSYMAGVVEATHGLRARVVPLGVDVEAFKPRGLAREPYVLCPAAIHRRKRQDLLIRALGRLPAARRPRLVLVYSSEGRGHVERLQALAREHQVTLELRKGLDDEGLLDAYSRAAAVAYVPEAEPFGLVALEALATATPFVGSAEGGLTELVEDGVTGRLVAATPEAVAEALEATLREPARFVEAGLARVRAEWTWEKTAERLEAVLLEVVG